MVLLCLFWCNLIFCLISLHVRSDVLRVIIVCALGSVGYYLGYCETFVPLFIDVAFTALPFFTFGYYLTRSNLLYPNSFDRYNLLFAFVLWGISYLLYRITDHRLSLHYIRYFHRFGDVYPLPLQVCQAVTFRVIRWAIFHCLAVCTSFDISSVECCFNKSRIYPPPIY